MGHGCRSIIFVTENKYHQRRIEILRSFTQARHRSRSRPRYPAPRLRLREFRRAHSRCDDRGADLRHARWDDSRNRKRRWKLERQRSRLWRGGRDSSDWIPDPAAKAYARFNRWSNSAYGRSLRPFGSCRCPRCRYFVFRL